jgi:hypothetical protein
MSPRDFILWLEGWLDGVYLDESYKEMLNMKIDQVNMSEPVNNPLIYGPYTIIKEPEPQTPLPSDYRM